MEWQWIEFVFGFFGAFGIQAYRLQRKIGLQKEFKNVHLKNPDFLFCFLTMSFVGGILAAILPLSIFGSQLIDSFIIGLSYDPIFSTLTLIGREKANQLRNEIGQLNRQQQDFFEEKKLAGETDLDYPELAHYSLGFVEYLRLLFVKTSGSSKG